MRDGVPAHSIAWSYLKGAARDRLTPRPGRRFAAAAAALLAAAGSLGVLLALLSASVPASAASSVHARVTRRDAAAARLVMLRTAGGCRRHGKEALPSLEALPVKITWDMTAGRAGGDAVPSSSYDVAGARALSPGSIAVLVTAGRPAGHHRADGHAGHC